MDLSQQELPLTAYFTSGNKETRPRTCSSKKRTSIEDSLSGVRPLKRGRSDVKSSTQKSPKKIAHQSKPHVKTTQLPTPATATRKSVFSTRDVSCLEGAVKRRRPATARAVEAFLRGKSIVTNDIDLTLAGSEITPSKALPKSCEGKEKDTTDVTHTHSLPTPTFSNRQKRLTGVSPLHEREAIQVRQVSGLTDYDLPTPMTGLRRVHVSESLHGIQEQSPSTGPSRHQYQPSGLSPVSTRSPTEGISGSRLNSHRSDPSHLHEQDNPFASPVIQGQSAHSSAPQKSFVSSITKILPLPSQTFDAHPLSLSDIPSNPVPSSQSQYLLHIDATPKRKRVSRRVETVPSSQTQEENDLTKSMPSPFIHAFAVPKSSVREFPETTQNANASPSCPSHGRRKSRQAYISGSTPITLPATSPSVSFCSFFATKKASEELSSLKSPSRQLIASVYRSPSRKTRATSPQKLAREDSIKNAPPAPEDDSVTESESEIDIFLSKANDRSSLLKLPSPGKELSPLRSSSAPELHSTRPHKLIHEDILPAIEDDSATEAESDTDILDYVAKIQKPQAQRSHAPARDFPSRPVISPLVSPARSRIAAEASFAGSTQFLMREGAGLSIPGTSTLPSCALAPRRLLAPSDFVPSVVQDFVEMFQGDGSYPEDFPESLRI
ncbi:hypothetical protein PAXRUDRAFT_287538 [Paxillus rubicundulus Ve08.2h10]|uniref:Unplaced genomic scaffold scaffold_15, whole genome shotgun sequence n=1 Tax=Paxillus rubicundulus Ve08.2h10 TaxID=930991 RepID=A0A0D0DXJ7_9AGAM|nr:hypothetical protein PAXRUDRAFT_287538 [Paxillus rubicundulus Ve08.2h10]